MNRFPTDFDQECADGLSSAELSELVIGYAQENERLEAEVDALHKDLARIKSLANVYRTLNKVLTNQLKSGQPTEFDPLLLSLSNIPYGVSIEELHGGTSLTLNFVVPKP